MAEALACGTPVVTFKRESAPEVVAHGETGFVVETMDEFVDAVKHVNEISPENAVTGWRRCLLHVLWLITTSTCI
jgi:glycosyltransferase involved in cell wall biosynthesis